MNAKFVKYFEMQVIVLYITGSLHSVLSSEHQKEIKRHTYNHQVM